MSSSPFPSVISLNYHLRKAGAPDHLRHLILDLAKAAKYIVREVWHGKVGTAGTSNVFQEEQVEMDVLSNTLLEQHLRENELVCCYASEESEEIVELHPNAPYSVVFDPLDGSSLVDSNFAIGTIVGIFDGQAILGRTPREFAAALYVLYGPRTTMTYSLGGGKGVHEFVLDDIGEFVLSREFLGVGDEAKVYAPGNISAAAEVPGYKILINHWIAEKKTLRYSGCMVPDVHHILSKGNGIFLNVGGAKYPEGKLRLAFECGPFAYLIEEAGGASSNGKMSILDLTIDRIDQRTPFIVGSRNEVERAVKMLSVT
jgi:fructose-1,6-bisphosphatase I